MFHKSSSITKYVFVDTQKCSACWNCCAVCPQNVIGKINLGWHKHIVFVDSEKCSGCKKCLTVCNSNALSDKIELYKNNEHNKKTYVKNLVYNLLLLFAGFISAFSGVLLQLKYHMGAHYTNYQYNKVIGFDYFQWSDIHKVSIVLFSVFMIYHFFSHINWFKSLLKKTFLIKQKQNILLGFIFIVLSATGYIAWLIYTIDNTNSLRKLFIEIHDKIALIFIIVLIIHLWKRIKWYFKMIQKINEK